MLELQSELNATLTRLETLEMQSREISILKNDLLLKESEMTSLRNQLTDEQLNRSGFIQFNNYQLNRVTTSH